jgi:hypothetical protein
MPRVEIPFPLSTSPGTNRRDGAGRVVNAYWEPSDPALGYDRILRRAPGLLAFSNALTETGVRGVFECNGVFFAGFDGELFRCTSAGGAMTSVGLWAGTDKIFFARNNKTPTPDMVAVSPANGATTFTTSAVAGAYPDNDLPVVNAVCSIDGYLVFTTGDGRAFATELNDTAVNSLSFGRAEAKPDGLLRPIPFGGRLYLFGPATTEVWTNVGTTPFPFARNEVLPFGLRGRYAIAGHEDAFSQGPIFVASDNTVRMMSGYEATKISPPDLDKLIDAVATDNDLEACCYIAGGHSFWELSSPTWTWVFNLNNQKWHEVESYNMTRSRKSCTVYAFSKWLCGTTDTPRIRQITRSSAHEAGDPFRVRVESGPVKKFPNGMRVARADFDMATGIGIATGTDPIQTDPTVEISCSVDGGLTYNAPWVRKMGRQSVTTRVPPIFNCGISRGNGHRWRVDISDPVDIAFFGGSQDSEMRR